MNSVMKGLMGQCPRFFLARTAPDTVQFCIASTAYCATLQFCYLCDLRFLVDGIAPWIRSVQKTRQMQDVRQGQRGVMHRSISGRKIVGIGVNTIGS